jgi:hypothetical protein
MEKNINNIDWTQSNHKIIHDVTEKIEKIKFDWAPSLYKTGYEDN